MKVADIKMTGWFIALIYHFNICVFLLLTEHLKKLSICYMSTNILKEMTTYNESG